MDKILTITVLYGTEVLELGQCDADHISLINLVHATTKEFSGRSELPSGGFTVSAELPWSSDTIMVSTYSELLDVFRQFVFRGYDAIRFQIKTTHCPPSNTPHSPIDEPEVVEQIGWCNEEAAMLDCEANSEGGDTESDEGVDSDGEDVQIGETMESKCEGVYQDMFDEGVQTGETMESKGEGVYQAMFDEFDVGLDVNEGMFDEFDAGLDGVATEDVNNGERVGLDDGGVEDEGVQTAEGVQTVEGVQNEQGVGIDGDYVVGDDEITKQCMALFNGYESRSDDDYFSDSDSDSDQENNKKKLGKLMEGIPFEKQKGNEIKFFVGQTFGSKEEIRDNFREYAIREGVTLVDKHDYHRVYNNSEAKVKWIASKVESLVKSNPTVSVKLLSDLLLERYNVTVDIKKLYNVKHRVMSQLRSEHNSAFRYLRQYAYTLNETNHGTTIHIKVQKPLNTFHRHLCFMSDRQKGLIKALETHFSFATTRYCARHIDANFRSSYPGDNYKKMFWKSSRSSNLFHFNAALDSIGEVDTKANEWLQKIDPHYWSRFAYDQYIRCDHVTNNMTEAFSIMLGTHRAQNYLQLLEFIRRMVMRKLQERREECNAWRDVLPPRVNARIIKNSKASRQLTIIPAGDQEYELVGPDGTFAVKLREYHCGCGSWQISGIPCPHAMVAISHN
ncbi:hypothetical protein EZV62_012505 [Acer yangbiense]|uniref:SWIM-type domain-containing protein n=1 Tax=Acer yangbiense TaxID=1000413 RepID=A0A5C7HY93_9ROSI|nr:hypothetical protein EZV62_012505 [Acer yangbiense]